MECLLRTISYAVNRAFNEIDTAPAFGEHLVHEKI